MRKFQEVDKTGSYKEEEVREHTGMYTALAYILLEVADR
jgi:hypothetical protein